MANIITSGKKAGEDHAVEAALKALSLNETADDEEETIKQCSIVKTECSKSLAEKMLATKADGYNILLKIALNKDHEKASTEAVHALAALLQANPDPFDEHGFAVIMQCFEQGSNSDDAKIAGLAMAQAVCVRHEQNRQNLVKNNILNILDNVFEQFPDKVAGIWMSLVQDDDVRVPYGKAHDNARDIVENHDGLGKLIKVLKTETPDQALLLSCLRSLAVRNEYCQSIADLGGLDCLFDLLSKEKQSRGVVKEALLVLKALAGNDQLKKEIRASQKIGVIVSIISDNMVREQLFFFLWLVFILSLSTCLTGQQRDLPRGLFCHRGHLSSDARKCPAGHQIWRRRGFDPGVANTHGHSQSSGKFFVFPPKSRLLFTSVFFP